MACAWLVRQTRGFSKTVIISFFFIVLFGLHSTFYRLHFTVIALPPPLTGQTLLGLLLGMSLGLFPINKVEPPGLDLAVDKEADCAGKDLLGGGVVVGVAWEKGGLLTVYHT